MDTVVIFDADFLLYSATMGKKCCDDEGTPILVDNKFSYIPRSEKEVYEAADDIINSIINTTGAKYSCGYIGGEKSFRYNIYPEYKANRVNRVKPDFINELRYYLKSKWGFEFTRYGLEADDAVNIVRNNLKNEYDCIIATSDKDLIKSISGKYINVRNMELIETSMDEATAFFWQSMICGDTVDNIKGVEGKGPKFAQRLFESGGSKTVATFEAYIARYGVDSGIHEFYKNYKCLKMLDSHPDFEMPVLQENNEVIWREING